MNSQFRTLADIRSSSILVLKDGHLVEQGTHRELLEKNRVFASMWADQNSSDEAPIPYAEQNAKKDVEGYPMEPEDEPTTQSELPQDALAPSATPDQNDISGEEVPTQDDAITTDVVEEQIPEEPAAPADDSGKKSYAAVVASEPPLDAKPESDAVAFPSTEPVPDSPPAAASDAPVAFPSYDVDTTEPFPAPPQSPGVTFDASTQFPTPRSSTPDLSSEPKRKRTASQNFQKFARRVSLVARRSGSSTSIPVPATKKDEQAKDGNGDGSATPLAEGSIRGESPASSIQGDDGKKAKRKAKKRFSLK